MAAGGETTPSKPVSGRSWVAPQFAMGVYPVFDLVCAFAVGRRAKILKFLACVDFFVELGQYCALFRAGLRKEIP